VTEEVFPAARAFLDREGRLIERRLAAVLFDGADASGVIDAVRAYRNPDGGFGHGLEPDKRCPASLPIDVECALGILLVANGGDSAAGSGDPVTDELVRGACEWLASVAAPDGAVPLAFPIMERYPRAEHWSDWTYTPGLNPTAGLAGRLHQLGSTHPWLDRATDWTWERLESGFDEDAHSLIEVMVFLAHVPDRGRAQAVAPTWANGCPRPPGTGRIRRIPATGSPLSTWRRRRTAPGDDCSATQPFRATSTAWCVTNSQTAAGRSPGNHRGAPPLWSGAGSRPSALCAPFGPTVDFDDLDSRASHA
jgi:hypothetical protein